MWQFRSESGLGKGARHHPKQGGAGGWCPAAYTKSPMAGEGCYARRQLNSTGRRLAKGGAEMSESKHARKRPGWVPWAALGGALVVGGLAGGFIGAAINSSSASTTASTAPPTTPSASGLSVCAVPSVADKVIPSVVTISAKKGTQA